MRSIYYLASFALLPSLVAQESKPATVAAVPAEVLLVAEGARYRWDRSWPQLPPDMKLGNTHGGIVVTKNGDVLFNTDTDHAIVVIGADGKFARAWGKEYAGGLHGMCLVEEQGEEFLYLAHTRRHAIFKVKLDGTVVWTVGYPKAAGIYAKEAEYNPTAIAVASDGRCYVGDGYGKSWVHIYDKDGNYQKSFGGPGKEPGQMHCPHGVMIDRRGKVEQVLVADRENHRIQCFDLQGNLVRVLPVELRRPCSIHERDGKLVIADLAGRITLLNDKDELIAHLGDNPDEKKRAQNGVAPDQWRAGEFIAPHSAAFASNGDIYVMDWNAHGRVTRLALVRP